MGGCNPDTYKLQNLTSQDFMLGMRWRFPIESAPMMVQQQVVQPARCLRPAGPRLSASHRYYAQPAPVYTQPAPMMMPQPAPMMVPQPQAPLSTRGLTPKRRLFSEPR